MVNLASFLKTWSLRSNNAARQINFNRTKIGEKCQNSKATFWVIFKQCDFVDSKKKSGLHSVRSPRIFHSSIRCIFQTVDLGNSRTLAPLFLCNFFCWCLFVLYPDPWHFYGSNLWSVQIRGHFQDDAAIKWPFKGKCALLLLVISTHCDVLCVMPSNDARDNFAGKNLKRQRKNAYKGCVNHHFLLSL